MLCIFLQRIPLKAWKQFASINELICTAPIVEVKYCYPCSICRGGKRHHAKSNEIKWLSLTSVHLGSGSLWLRFQSWSDALCIIWFNMGHPALWHSQLFLSSSLSWAHWKMGVAGEESMGRGFETVESWKVWGGSGAPERMGSREWSSHISARTIPF